jgi:hypothetical protein
MAVDARREAAHIHKQFQRYQKNFGESVAWYQFDTVTSQYDSIYDEGYRQYLPPVKVPVLWIDQQEDSEYLTAEGRRATQNVRFAVGARSLWECGISVTEAHGGRVWDHSASEVWHDDRLNDIIFYDGRFYGISNFQIRGRLQGEDIIIGVGGIEIHHSDELNLDSTPLAWFPPRDTEE